MALSISVSNDPTGSKVAGRLRALALLADCEREALEGQLEAARHDLRQAERRLLDAQDAARDSFSRDALAHYRQYRLEVTGLEQHVAALQDGIRRHKRRYVASLALLAVIRESQQ